MKHEFKVGDLVVQKNPIYINGSEVKVKAIIKNIDHQLVELQIIEGKVMWIILPLQWFLDSYISLPDDNGELDYYEAKAILRDKAAKYTGFILGSIAIGGMLILFAKLIYTALIR